MKAVITWVLEILLMMIIALAWPEILTFDSMVGGMAFALLAWVPAGMVWALFDS